MDKFDMHQLDPIWMTICLTKKYNVKKSIDNSRGVHIWKCERLIVLGVKWVAMGAYAADTWSERSARGAGRFLDTSRTSGTPYQIQKVRNTKKTNKYDFSVYVRIINSRYTALAADMFY